MNGKLGVNRAILCKITGISNFEMSDFWDVCPYTFEGWERQTRKREILFWRNVGMLYAYLSGYTLEKAGKMFHRDHATVIHSIKSIVTAYEGWGHIELVDIINTIKNYQLINVNQSHDVGVNYAVSQVILDSMMADIIEF
jgi:hypothetical protein